MICEEVFAHYACTWDFRKNFEQVSKPFQFMNICYVLHSLEDFAKMSVLESAP